MLPTFKINTSDLLFAAEFPKEIEKIYSLKAQLITLGCTITTEKVETKEINFLIIPDSVGIPKKIKFDEIEGVQLIEKEKTEDSYTGIVTSRQISSFIVDKKFYYPLFNLWAMQKEVLIHVNLIDKKDVIEKEVYALEGYEKVMKEFNQITEQKEAAIKNHVFEKAAHLRDREKELLNQYTELLEHKVMIIKNHVEKQLKKQLQLDE